MAYPPPGSHTIVITQAALPIVGSDPVRMTCPYCLALIITRVEYSAGTRTHLWAGLLCLLTGYLCCCLVPYCLDDCKNADHYCPSCNHFVASSMR